MPGDTARKSSRLRVATEKAQGSNGHKVSDTRSRPPKDKRMPLLKDKGKKRARAPSSCSETDQSENSGTNSDGERTSRRRKKPKRHGGRGGGQRHPTPIEEASDYHERESVAEEVMSRMDTDAGSDGRASIGRDLRAAEVFDGN